MASAAASLAVATALLGCGARVRPAAVRVVATRLPTPAPTPPPTPSTPAPTASPRPSVCPGPPQRLEPPRAVILQAASGTLPGVVKSSHTWSFDRCQAAVFDVAFPVDNPAWRMRPPLTVRQGETVAFVIDADAPPQEASLARYPGPPDDYGLCRGPAASEVALAPGARVPWTVDLPPGDWCLVFGATWEQHGGLVWEFLVVVA